MTAKSILTVFSVVASISIASAEEEKAYTIATFSEQAGKCGSSAANDLGNEIIVRINAGQNPELKKLIATDQLAAELRERCNEALARVIKQETGPVPWQTKPTASGEKKMIREATERDFTLNLGKGLEWNQKVKVSWRVSDVSVDNIKPPVRSMLWVSFELPTLPVLAGGDMKIGGGGSLRTNLVAYK